MHDDNDKEKRRRRLARNKKQKGNREYRDHHSEDRGTNDYYIDPEDYSFSSGRYRDKY